MSLGLSRSYAITSRGDWYTCIQSAVQRCSSARRQPEGDSIAVRRLSSRSQRGSYAIKLAILRPTADDCAIAGPLTGFGRLRSIKRYSYPKGYPINYSIAI